MNFRNRGQANLSKEAAGVEISSSEKQLDLGNHGRGRWSTTFLVIGSALLGATAIALWNRNTIATLRVQIEKKPENPVLPARLEDEIL